MRPPDTTKFTAFLVDAASALLVGDAIDRDRLRSLMHHHRGHG